MTAWNSTSSGGEPGESSYELTFSYRDEQAYSAEVEELVESSVASAIARRDPTLWGPEAVEEAGKRLAWVDLHELSRSLVDPIETLRAELADRGVDHVVLCGMGGSSLAPEVITAAAGVELTVLDSSDPTAVRAALADRLEATVVVVSSKSGSTLETDSQRRAYEQAFRDAGVDPAERVVIVTDPGSPLDKDSRAAGYQVFNADPEVGGRYSALTAFGLVPSGLAGADLTGLLDQAAAIAPALAADSVDNPGLRLGALLGVAAQQGVDKLVLADVGSSIPGFGDWAEQLVAESTGKSGTGILPVVVEGIDAPNADHSGYDTVLAVIGSGHPLDANPPASGWSAVIDAPLGAQMLLWEHATVVAGRVLGINPFDQPDVESAKSAARGLLEERGPASDPAFTDGAVEVRATGGLQLGDADTVPDAVEALLATIDRGRGYLAVMAYLDRVAESELSSVRATLAARTGRPTTFGWGPRFLHSTGQYHKGGPATGVYLQVTGEPAHDLDVPGRDFTFGEFMTAQAAGDAQVLADRDRPVLKLHLTDRAQGLPQLLEALR